MHTKEQLDVQGSPMDLLLFMPAGDGPFPGMVVAQHLPVAHAGLEKDPFTLDVGKKFAAAGYAVAIPYVFHWWPPEEDMAVKREAFRDDWARADLDAAFTHLAGLPAVDADRIGIIGHCWGGRLAWLAACHNPDYQAAVVLYGGRIKVGLGPDAAPPIERAAHIACPVLGIFGNDDENPSPADVDDLDAALTKGGVTHVFHRYDDAGHGFQDYTNPDRYRAAATEDAWQKIFAFLAARLQP